MPLLTLRPRLPVVLYVATVMAAGTALAQPAKEYQPKEGQPGKDVVWVPTAQGLIDKMLDMAKAAPGDYVIDLGSGDGRTVITAAKRGIKAHGIEYNPDMVELSKRNAEKAGVLDKATFAHADIFESDFSDATVITLFLLPQLNLRLRPTLLKMRPGTRVVSNTFDMGDWPPEETVQAPGECHVFCRAHLWIVPAKVDGEWRLGEGVLTLTQKYQAFTGKLTTGNVVAPITDGKLVGDAITFTAGGTHYAGRATGVAMEGTAKAGNTEALWRANPL
ncbi:MAG: class I SAM-dependent methyltransferase [Hyphomicrobiaceae bacterium]|nr:class I SAM-dependent methyltransferase [Hyphomicrobiaceae bacterium]